jgi:hypothetical protein
MPRKIPPKNKGQRKKQKQVEHQPVTPVKPEPTGEVPNFWKEIIPVFYKKLEPAMIDSALAQVRSGRNFISNENIQRVSSS